MDQTNHASSWLNGSETFVIAEAGVNHNGSIDLALELVRCAKRAGADAVKFQTFTAEQLVTMSAPKAAYQQRSGDARETQFEMLKRLELDRDAHLALIDECRKQDILFMSTPFNHDAADLLMDLGVQAFKVSSGDATNVPFLRYLGAFGIPVILSTGCVACKRWRLRLRLWKSRVVKIWPYYIASVTTRRTRRIPTCERC